MILAWRSGNSPSKFSINRVSVIYSLEMKKKKQQQLLSPRMISYEIDSMRWINADLNDQSPHIKIWICILELDSWNGIQNGLWIEGTLFLMDKWKNNKNKSCSTRSKSILCLNMWRDTFNTFACFSHLRAKKKIFVQNYVPIDLSFTTSKTFGSNI